MSEGIMDFLMYHIYSIVTISFICSVIIVNHVGSLANLAVAKKHHELIHPLLAGSFKHYQPDFIVESPNVIKVYASGKDTCVFAILGYAMVPRHQILSFLFNSTIIRLKDELVIQIPISNPRPIPITLAVIRKKQLRTITKKLYPDIKNLCKEYRPMNDTIANVPPTHSILVQQMEHVNYILGSEKEVELWGKHGHAVKMLYLSDINKFSRYEMGVRMVLNLGEDTAALVQWLLGFVDRMARVRMSAGDRKEARKRREGLQIDYDAL